MKTKKNISKCMKVSLAFIVPLILSCSCQKDDPLISDDQPLVKSEDTLRNYSPEVSFEITDHLLEGKAITCIEPNYKGNTWVASGKELYYVNDSLEKTYTLNYPILDISVAGDSTLWIATQGGGLGHLSGNEVTWFNRANSNLPRDSIWNVEVGSDGRVWFSSVGLNHGGLFAYDGKKFKLFTPDNSILSQHIISDIGIDRNGSIYVISSSGKVGGFKVYKITDGLWECLGNHNETFYSVYKFAVGPAGIVFFVVDYTLSSSSFSQNIICEFRDNNWHKLEADFMSLQISGFAPINADRRNYCWIASKEDDSDILHVYNGISWEKSPKGLFQGDKITTIEVDIDNNIWVGTSQNGIFVLKQERSAL